MATKGKGKGNNKAKQVQQQHAKHAEAYAKHEADLENSIAGEHVRAANAKAGASKKSAAQVKAMMKDAIENKKSSAEVMLAAIEGFSKAAEIERDEAKKVAALQKKLGALVEKNQKQQTQDNLEAIEALSDELEEVKGSFAEKANKVLASLEAAKKADAAAANLLGTRIGKQIAKEQLKERREEYKGKEADFLKNRRETINALQAKMKIASATGDAELRKLLAFQLDNARKNNVADFEAIQKRIDKKLEASDESTQAAFKTAEKLAEKRGFINRKLDSIKDAKDALTLTNFAKATVGKLGFGEGRTINDLNANRRAMNNISIADRYKKNEDAAKKANDLADLKEEHPEMFGNNKSNPFSDLKESARPQGEPGGDDIYRMRAEEDAKAETDELKGINKSLAKLAKDGLGGGSSSGSGNSLPMDLLSKVSSIGAGISSIVGILGTVALAVAPLAVMYGVTKWAETASIRDKKGNMTGTGKVLNSAQKALGGQGLKPQQDMSRVERLNADTTFASTLGISSDLFGTKKKALIKKYQWQFESGATFSPEEAAVLKKNLGLEVPPQNIKKPGATSGAPLPSTGAGGGRGNGQAQVSAMAKDSASVAASASKAGASSGSAAPSSAASSAAGSGRGNGQAQMSSIASNGGSDGKATSVSGPGSEKLQNLVTTTGNVDLSDLTPQATSNLTSLASDYNSATGKKLKINSGFRSREKQAQLYADYKAGKPGANPANPPGSSLHEVGLAVDADPSQVDEMDRMGLIAKNGFERISGPRERQHLQLAGAQNAISGSGSLVSGDAIGAGPVSTKSAGESTVDAPTKSAGNSNTKNGQISVASSDDNSSVTSVEGPSNVGAGAGRGGGGGGANRGSAISVASVPTFMFNDPAFYATNVQAMA
jgi:hypothetical protein